MEKTFDYNSYGFMFKGEYQNSIVGLNAIGYELQQTHDYQWNGLNRGEKDIFIFQYTLKGRGAIRVGNQITHLESGDAFFVHVPSNHKYYLPQDSTEWEFLYFTIYGDVANQLFHQITDAHGHIFKIALHAEPIQYILETLEKIETLGINHGYSASAYAYTFIMKCLEHFEHGYQQSNNYPLPIVKAIQFIEGKYKEDITLDDIVEVSNLSKYHFTRQFRKYVKETPISYLTNIRINNSLPFLCTNTKSVEWIAQEVGFQSSNYFSKVFKKIIGVSPNRYRKDTTMMPVNKIFTD